MAIPDARININSVFLSRGEVASNNNVDINGFVSSLGDWVGLHPGAMHQVWSSVDGGPDIIQPGRSFLLCLPLGLVRLCPYVNPSTTQKQPSDLFALGGKRIGPASERAHRGGLPFLLSSKLAEA